MLWDCGKFCDILTILIEKYFNFFINLKNLLISSQNSPQDENYVAVKRKSLEKKSNRTR